MNVDRRTSYSSYNTQLNIILNLKGNKTHVLFGFVWFPPFTAYLKFCVREETQAISEFLSRADVTYEVPAVWKLVVLNFKDCFCFVFGNIFFCP